jgi:hypothetical protein
MNLKLKGFICSKENALNLLKPLCSSQSGLHIEHSLRHIIFGQLWPVWRCRIFRNYVADVTTVGKTVQNKKSVFLLLYNFYPRHFATQRKYSKVLQYDN